MENWGILMPVFGHLVLLQVLFVMVSYKRISAVRARDVDQNDFAYNDREPEASRRWAKNLDNQFQLPPLFYALVALLIATDQVTQAQVWLAWMFLAGRIAHTAVQTQSDNVRLRGMVFGINYVALSAMWLLFFLNFFSAGA